MARINSNLYVPTARVSETETIEIAAVMQQRNGMDEPITLAGVMAHRPDIDPSAPWQPVSSSNPLEVRVRELEAELQQLRQLFQGGDAKVQLSGSSELKKASLGAFVTHRTATLVRGVNIWFNSTGTNPLGSNERVVVVDIAGPGRLIQADIYATDNHSGVRPRLSVDGSEQNVFVLHGMTDNTRLGLTEGRRVGAWEVVKNSIGKYAISLDGARVGAWGTSFKLELENATSQGVGMAAYVWYAVMSSSNLVLAGSGAPIPAQDVRGVLATNWPTLDDYTVITRPGDDQGNGWECEVFWRNGVAEQTIRSLLAQEFGLNQLHS